MIPGKNCIHEHRYLKFDPIVFASYEKYCFKVYKKENCYETIRNHWKTEPNEAWIQS